MAINQKRRQKKLMKKRQKDKVRRSERTASVPYALLSPAKKIRAARKLPIYECLINPSWKEDGLATILLSRRQPDDNILFATYLVDIFCLGLKDTFCNADFSLWRYEAEVRPRIHPTEKIEECAISVAHHIIYGAIDFAWQYGFRPHKDFELSQCVLEPVDSIEPCEEIEFGKDGQPYYIAGPHDNVEYILRQLESKVPAGKFNFVCRSDDLDSTEIDEQPYYEQ